ncbi:MAG: oligopeptide transport system substrate-binding protein, partial [Myxococcota bacterium]
MSTPHRQPLTPPPLALSTRATSRCLVLFCLASVVASVGCRKKAVPDTAPAAAPAAARTSLGVAMFEPRSIDPAQLSDGLGPRVAESVLEGLLTLSATGEPVAGVAERWSVSDNGLVWTFHLRAGLTWSDGTPLGAQDFVWSLRRALSPATANPQVAMLAAISGATAVAAGTAKPESLGVAAPDAHTLTITLVRPQAGLPRLLARAYTFPVPRHVVTKHPTDWTHAEHFVGNGPYVLVEHVHQEKMVLKRNPRFREAHMVAIETIVLRFTTSVQQGFHWYTLGEVDWSDGLIPSDTVGELKKTSAPELRIDPYDGIFYL